jgi:hypothetical protein
MTDNVAIVFHGFLNLPNLEKLQLVEAVNEYFDSMEREPIRRENEEKFAKLGVGSEARKCTCCGR